MKVGIQTGNLVEKLGFERGYAALKEVGFEGIDWNLDHACSGMNLINGTYRGTSILEKSLDEVISFYEEELSIIKKNGLSILQCHAPFPSYVVGRPDVMEYCIEIFGRLIEFCDYIDCPYIVTHPAFSKPAMTTRDIDEINEKFYTALIPILLQCKNKVIVCIENSDARVLAQDPPYRYIYMDDDFCGIPSKAPKVIDAYNRMAGEEVFGLCLDTGHLNLTGVTVEEYILKVGKRLKVLHIHDNNAAGDWHLAPFTGTVDWNGFCRALQEIGYSGNLAFETFAHLDRALEVDEEVAMIRLTNIAGIGRAFRKRIESGV